MRSDFETSRPSVEILLFDLGGVLVQWDGVEALRSLTGNRLTQEQARKFWLDSPSVRRFEKGESQPEEFATEAVTELGLKMAPADFLSRFAEWDRGTFPGVPELLTELRSEFRLACLSNNNAVAWPRIQAQLHFEEFFERCYSSHEIGVAKPDREIFQFVLKDLQSPAERILFFDDNPECVDGARSVGMRADLVSGVDEVRRALRRRGLTT